MRRVLLALLLVLAACDRLEAPAQSGVCWRLHEDAAGHATFTPLARDVGNLETCAVLLEGHRLLGEADTDGAFQGYFVFADAAGISSSQRRHGFRFPIFQPPQRAAVDRDLMKVIKSHGGRLPDAANIAVERNQ